jgi:hypothetical protein
LSVDQERRSIQIKAEVACGVEPTRIRLAQDFARPRRQIGGRHKTPTGDSSGIDGAALEPGELLDDRWHTAWLDVSFGLDEDPSAGLVRTTKLEQQVDLLI